VKMEIASKTIPVEASRLVTFRPAAAEDDTLLLQLYASMREEELALTNWDAAQREAFLRMQLDAQQTHYRKYYPGGEHLAILVDGEAIGRLYVAVTDREVRILDITILPARRNAGIGTPVVRELMHEAEALAKPLTIYVEANNPSLRLFERLGFVKAGENGYSFLMEWRPEAEKGELNSDDADRTDFHGSEPI
jgi:ribosomal protein S18 acetylase RimI-like enzyme